MTDPHNHDLDIPSPKNHEDKAEMKNYYSEVRDTVLIGNSLGKGGKSARGGSRGFSLGTGLLVVAILAAVIIGGLMLMKKTPEEAVATATERAEEDANAPSVVVPEDAPAPVDDGRMRLADFVGVNTHIQNSGSPYANRENLEAALNWLGVKHVRDGIDPFQFPYKYFNRLHDNTGVKLSIITGFGFFEDKSDDPKTQLDRISEIVAADEGHDLVVLIEGQNEPDLFVKGDDWPQRSAAFQKRLWNELKTNPAYENLREIAVAGPSVTGMGSALEKWAETFRDAEKYMDYGNIHPYPGGFEPEGGFGVIPLSKNIERGKLLGGMPLLVTETGYLNDSEDYEEVLSFSKSKRADGIWVSETAAGVFLPRLLLSQLEAGIERVYWYELFDLNEGGKSTNWGLFENNGTTPKPAAYAMQNFLSELGNTSLAEVQTALVADAADGKEIENLRQLVLDAPGGEKIIAIWLGTGLWDGFEGYGEKKESAPDQREVVLSGLPAGTDSTVVGMLETEAPARSQFRSDSQGRAKFTLSERVQLIRLK